MITVAKKFIKFLINILLKVCIILQGLIKIFFNMKKIYNSKYIVLQSGGGFAHTILIPNFIRSMKNKKEYLYILFFDLGRYNYYTKYIHNINQINIYTSLF